MMKEFAMKGSGVARGAKEETTKGEGTISETTVADSKSLQGAPETDPRVLLHGVCPVCGKAPSYCVTTKTFVEEDCSFVNGLTLAPGMLLDAQKLLENWVPAMWNNIKSAYEDQGYCSHCNKPVKVVVTEAHDYKEYSLSCGCAKTDRKYTNFGQAYMNWRAKAQAR